MIKKSRKNLHNPKKGSNFASLFRGNENETSQENKL